MKRIYFDAEFTGLRRETTLISLGLVTEEGRTFYAEFTDYHITQLDDWIRTNVVDKLRFNDRDSFSKDIYDPDDKAVDQDRRSVEMKGNRSEVCRELKAWLEDESKNSQWTSIPGEANLQILTDCYAYDWMLLVDLLTMNVPGGTAMDMPSCVYYIPIDLSTYLWSFKLDPDVSRESYGDIREPDSETMKHNALWDAQVIKACFERLDGIRKSIGEGLNRGGFGWEDFI
jgi:hypothetical protein